MKSLKYIAAIAVLMPFVLKTEAQPSFITNGLVAYYPFNGNANDASGNGNNGTVTGAILTEDMFGNSNSAYLFAGTDANIAIPFNGTNFANDFTASVWFKVSDNDNGFPTLLYEQNTSFMLQMVGDNSGTSGVGELEAYAYSASGLPFSWFIQPDQQTPIGTFCQAVVTKSGTNVTMYLNSQVVVAGFVSNPTVPPPGTTLYVGEEQNNSGATVFHGIVDDIRIYNRALSPNEVQELYTYESTPPNNGFITNGLVAYYPFNGNANDASGNGNNGIPQNVYYGIDRFGLGSSAAVFSGQIGTNSAIDCPTLDNIPYWPITYSCWFKLDGLTVADGEVMTLLGREDSDLSGNEGAIALISNQSLGFTNELAYTTPQLFDFNSFSPSTNTWYHSLLTITSNSLMSLYINGNLYGTAQTSLSTLTGTLPLPFRIGASTLDLGTINAGAPRYSWFGSIDDVRVYNRALSSAEVEALYAYESVPQVHFAETATATLQVVNGFVVGATITNPGSGYTNNPSVQILGGNGSGATATATLSGGIVVAITIINPGSGYTGTPSIVIAPPPVPPIQAQGTATVVNGFVTGVTITNPGSGYGTNVPSVYFLGYPGFGAAGTATVLNGMVTGVTITAPGSDYTNGVPSLLIAAPPGVPSLSLAITQVQINMNLIPGYYYQLQKSVDGLNWNAIGSSFLATNSTMSQVLSVTNNIGLFNIIQVP